MWILRSVEQPEGPEAAVPQFTFRLAPGAIKTVGRSTRADFIVDAGLVSRLHCRLTAGGESVEAVDLSSTNGTYLNDQRVERALLTTGDRLRMGRVEFTIERQG
jgi:pSer/pThr/pTyr-binding forkhead associated (FHA) protein